MINQEEEVEELHNSDLFNTIYGHDIIEIKGNFLPKGLVHIERLFSNHDMIQNPLDQPIENTTVNFNIGIKFDPKMVKLSKSLSNEQHKRYVYLIKESVHVLEWSYDELNTFDIGIVQHKMPLNPTIKPFKKKLTQLNPMLLPIIEKKLKKLLDAKIIVP